VYHVLVAPKAAPLSRVLALLDAFATHMFRKAVTFKDEGKNIMGSPAKRRKQVLGLAWGVVARFQCKLNGFHSCTYACRATHSCLS
jgi:hypothetical protein